jgi:hypothetical protein
MRLPATPVAVTVATLALAGCGYVGEPLPPALNIPVRITDLKAVEHGDSIVIEFTAPDKTTENLALKRRGEVELFAGEARVPAPPGKFGAMKVDTPARPFIGHEVLVRARTLNARGRASEWSNEVRLRVVEPLAAPKNLAAENVPEGVRLRWEAARGSSFRVFRAKDLKAASQKPEWTDTEVEYGSKYEYSVQAVLEQAESEVGGPVAITPEDKFPPAVPAGLQALAGTDTIELAWDRSAESDFKCYRVYRAVENGELERIADLVETPAFSDKAIQSGKKYRYAVSAVDQKGNESAKTEAVEMTAP